MVISDHYLFYKREQIVEFVMLVSGEMEALELNKYSVDINDVSTLDEQIINDITVIAVDDQITLQEAVDWVVNYHGEENMNPKNQQLVEQFKQTVDNKQFIAHIIEGEFGTVSVLFIDCDKNQLEQLIENCNDYFE